MLRTQLAIRPDAAAEKKAMTRRAIASNSPEKKKKSLLASLLPFLLRNGKSAVGEIDVEATKARPFQSARSEKKSKADSFS